MGDHTNNEKLKKKIKELEIENRELSHKNDLFQSIADKSKSAIIILDGDTILYANPAWAELHQVTPEDTINHKLADFAPLDLSKIDMKETLSKTSSAEMVNFIVNAQESGRLQSYGEIIKEGLNNSLEPFREGLLMRKDAEVRWLKTYGSFVPYKGKQVLLNIGQDITEQIISEQKVMENEEKYRALFEQTIVSIVLMDESGKHVEFNRNVYEVLGYTREEFEKISVEDTEAIKNHSEVQAHHKKIIEEGKGDTFETKLRHKNGEKIDMLINITPLKIGGKNYIQNVSIDITDRKKAEEMLSESYEKLEKRVEERTLELHLNSEMLGETNTALRVLLKRRDEDKTELEEKVLVNIQELIQPSIDKLKRAQLKTTQKLHVDVLESNLNDITSPFLHRLSMEQMKFTPSEVQVSNLIKQGRTTKEIAEYLNLSPRTVDFHRDKIRKKLGLNKEKVNLRTYLLTIK